MKKLNSIIIKIIIAGIIIWILIIMLLLSGWGEAWKMFGHCEFGDKTIEMRECIFNKKMYQDYRIRLSIGGIGNVECEVRLLDEDNNVINEWESITTDFEEKLDDEVIEELRAVEVCSKIPPNDEWAGVSYSIFIDGKKNYLKMIRNALKGI